MVVYFWKKSSKDAHLDHYTTLRIKPRPFQIQIIPAIYNITELFTLIMNNKYEKGKKVKTSE